MVVNLPKYKKKCRGCNKFKFIKPGWSYCLDCYEKTYGKYRGEDRKMFMDANG
jgi:hypothetical protein